MYSPHHISHVSVTKDGYNLSFVSGKANIKVITEERVTPVLPLNTRTTSLTAQRRLLEVQHITQLLSPGQGISPAAAALPLVTEGRNETVHS